MRPTLRVSLLTALFFTGYTGVVMASNTACQVAVFEQLRAAQFAVRKRAHHTAATLARWKIGAAAWSKAHGGKVYAGVPAPRRQDWTPLRFTCDDVALDLSRPDAGLLVAGEAVTEFAEYGGKTPWSAELDLRTAATPMESTWEQASAGSSFHAPFGGIAGAGGGGELNGPVGTAAFSPPPAPARLVAAAPTPESPTIVLLGTGMLSFLVSRLRRRTVV